MSTEEQTDVSRLFSSAITTNWWGQKLTISNRVVSKLSFYLSNGGGTGNVIYCISRVSDGGTIASKVQGPAANVGAASWLEVTLDTPVLINEQVYLMVTCTEVGDSVQIYDANEDAKADENIVRRLNEVYSDYPANSDFGYIYTYELAASPTVTTQTCKDVDPDGTTATGRGNITDLGDTSVTAHGHCWGTSSNPTIGSDSYKDNGAKTTTGTFISAITGLTAGTGYYTRGYATNSVGTSYGINVYFIASLDRAGYIWAEGSGFHFFDENAVERKLEGIGTTEDAFEFSEIKLTPKASSTGAEGTIFYDSGDDHIYVATE